MGITSDRDDPRLTHGVDEHPVDQAEAYLVLSDLERAKGFVRPVRTYYVHVGPPGPAHPLRPLTDEERVAHADAGYVAFETYPDGEHVSGRYWTQARLDAVDGGCGATTTMALPIAETYARQPHFYGSTYCVGCRMHRPVGRDGEFVWGGTTVRVGT